MSAIKFYRTPEGIVSVLEPTIDWVACADELQWHETYFASSEVETSSEWEWRYERILRAEKEAARRAALTPQERFEEDERFLAIRHTIHGLLKRDVQ